MAPRCCYIKTCRKACALTQAETAYLLGLKRGAAICKLEQGCKPSHLTTLAYMALLNAPARALFAGTFATVERRVKERTRVLIRRLKRQLEKHPDDNELKHKIEMLEELLSGKSVLPPEL